jgi:hypothetical protein
MLSKYTLHPTTSKGIKIDMPWDREDDPSQDEIDSFAESNRPKMNFAKVNGKDIPIEDDGPTDIQPTTTPPEPEKSHEIPLLEMRNHFNVQEQEAEPDTFTGGFTNSLKKQFLGAAIPAIQGAATPKTPGDFGNLMIPSMVPPLIRAKPAITGAFTEHLQPVSPMNIGEVAPRLPLSQRIMSERGSIGEEPPPPPKSKMTADEIIMQQKKADIKAKALQDPEFQKLSKNQKDIVLQHLYESSIFPSKGTPKLPNIEPPVMGTGSKGPQFSSSPLEADPNLPKMVTPNMFYPEVSPAMKPSEVPPLVPETARVSSRIQKEDLFPHTKLEKLSDKTMDAIHGSREIMASGDLSAPFRQAAFLVGRKEFWKNMPTMFKAAARNSNYEHIMEGIESRPTFSVMQDSGLAFTDLGKNMSNREEAFMSRLAGNLPVVKQSARAYTAYLNKVRADVFDHLYSNLMELKLKPEELKREIPALADYVNMATGRGSLKFSQNLGKGGYFGNIGIDLEPSAKGLNSLFFAPRLAASRLKLLNPMTYVEMPPQVRKEALKDLARFTAIGTTMLGLAKAGGGQVEIDPRSADFGKAKFNNTRFDMFGGFTQYIRLGSQLALNSTKSTNTGKVRTLGSNPVVPTKLDTIYTFMQNKEAPIPSFLTGYLSGKDYKGDKFDVPSEVMERFIPMILQDAYEVYQNDPGKLGITIPASGFGIGVQSYKPKVRNKGPKMHQFQNKKGYFDDFMSGAYQGTAGR